LLEGFAELLIPFIVWQKAIRHRPKLQLDKIPGAKIRNPVEPPPLLLAAAGFASELHAGEIAAITLLHKADGGMLLRDNDAARQTAESLGFPGAGTLGLLLRGIRRGQISGVRVRALVSDFRQHCTLHISNRLLKRFAESIPD